jgi:pyruvate,water dikinase
MVTFTKRFNTINAESTNRAGGKGASLGEMIQANIPVPPGFVVLTDAFKQFIEANDLKAEIDAALHEVRHEEAHTTEKASERIQGHIFNAPIPQDTQTKIEESFDELGADLVAVRSSATAEDASEEAWAGQLESFLNVTKDNVLEKVRECWASLFTPRAIFYRFENNLHDEDISVAVVVQKMVKSKAAGVAFSVHPVTEEESQMIIEAGFGLGDAVVGGEITPDNYVIEKDSWEIIDVNVNTQNKQYVRKDDGTSRSPAQSNEWQELSEEEANKQVLSKDQIVELGKIIATIEDHYGFPVDVEWAMEGGEFYIVQSRPVTTL